MRRSALQKSNRSKNKRPTIVTFSSPFRLGAVVPEWVIIELRVMLCTSDAGAADARHIDLAYEALAYMDEVVPPVEIISVENGSNVKTARSQLRTASRGQINSASKAVCSHLRRPRRSRSAHQVFLWSRTFGRNGSSGSCSLAAICTASRQAITDGTEQQNSGSSIEHVHRSEVTFRGQISSDPSRCPGIGGHFLE